jgi:A/G-specific adenine glycosylase
MPLPITHTIIPRAARNRFSSALLAWYATSGRHDLPWRKSRDPYKVLVSECMLQQTQVPRVIPKYRAFLRDYPTTRALATASRKDVLAHWHGLGYNSRAIRLHDIARNTIADSGLRGALPATYEGLLALKGVGPYTAGAVMAFAHDTPAPCVDVNIRRILARAFFPRTTIPTKHAIDALALHLAQDAHTMKGRAISVHAWTSALMDFGSAICTARTPACASCPARASCRSKGPRQDETDASRKQSAFLGSRRWWRGQILKTLLSTPVPEAHLLHRIKGRPTADEEDLYAEAKAALLQEGIIAKRGKTLEVRA